MTHPTLLHRARVLAQRFGIDITRHPSDRTGDHLVRLLDRFEIDTVLDAGAHTGGYGTLLRGSGFTGRIVSFEPLTAARAQLHRAAEEDPYWTVLPYALGDTSGTIELNVAGNAGASSSALPMLPRHRAAAPGSAYTGRQKAEVRRLDELWEEITAPGERVFLKLDVQGYEGHVLRGAGDYLDEVVGLQTETSFVPLYEGGPLFDEALGHAQRELGMSVMSMVPGFTDPDSGQMLQCDLVLFKQSDAREAALV
ncbi:FkbM family methyltransferase [Streptomyces sp. NBC_01304]|uniref:FkbM family methyltransferase n=1 Tax=Streptomyces sp. NBC_01304 TaxID=2903818 RepID=UPI002E12934C|nr:FkbM family methyltransferase [Streptomyces sp. NBC_01304]